MSSSISICSALVIVPLSFVCLVVISLFSPSSVELYQAILVESSHDLLCRVPYKELIIDSKNCDKQSYPDTDSTVSVKSPSPSADGHSHDDSSDNFNNVDDSDKQKNPLDFSQISDSASYSEFDTFILGMLKDEGDQISKEQGTREHGFNLFASDNIGLWRTVPDTRNEVCKDKVYKKDLPTISIVMCFYNEAWSTLLRSVHSLIAGTSQKLLKEIILIDDHSSFGHLKSSLDEYIKTNFSNVKIIHSPIRLGLIRARMEGAKHATGEVLVFLDSHIEVGPDWLPPLLDRIVRNRKTVVVPVIDTIEGETMIYKKAGLVRGSFTWSLLHNWEQLPLDVLKQVQVNADPFISPTMPGGLFAMERNYFYELGEYDSGMNIWGGENMEISFRIWQCGGRLEIVPCSRIGHVFRQFRPYTSPSGEDTSVRNSARVAHVWLDEYKKHFFNLRPLAKDMDYGDVSERVALRERLGCQSFRWFLETIHPEQIVPGEAAKVPGAYHRRVIRPPPTILAEGNLKHERSGLCAVPDKDPPTKGASMVLQKCHLLKKGSGQFRLGDNYELKLPDSNLCLETRLNRQKVFVMKCAPGGAQTWLQINKDGNQVLYNPPSGMCLAVNKPQAGVALTLDFCSKTTCFSFVVK